MADILYMIIIYPITQILEFTFFFSQKLFKESGISVIFISFTISVLCLPLYAVAEKLQQLERDTGKKLKPKADKIRKVFKGDEQYMILSTYYRQNHYHPIYALRSSFGLLIQVPFFIAAYSYLSHLEIIKNVPFLFIKDLGAPDALFSIDGFTVNLLPIVMTLINCFAGAIYVKGLPTRDKIQLYGMAGIFLILLYNSPSALVLYWTMNNIFSVVKNVYYRIQIKHKRHLLLGVYSAACILLAVFCIVKYGYISKARKLTFVCFFSAFIPWVFVIFRKQIIRIINIEYESNRSFAVFLISILMIWALFGLFIPSQLIASSPQEFSFVDDYTNPLFFLFITALQVFGFFVFWPVCLFFLFPNNVKKYFSVVFLAVSSGMLLNVFLFPGNYGLISINFLYDGSLVHSNRETLLNLCVLFILFVAAFVLNTLKNKNIILIPVSLCIFSLLCISVVNIIKIDASFNELKTYYVKEQKEIQNIPPIFSLSRTGKNIVVILLDRAASVFMPFIFEESPELKKAYSGFIFYPNTVSFNGYTSIGAPPVYGGYEYTPQEINKRSTIPLVEKHNQALIMLPRIFHENGFFSVCVTDPPYANYNWKSDLSIFNNYPGIKAYITDSQYTDLWLMEHNIQLPKTGDIIKRNMFWYSLFKGLPLFFRQPVYMDGSWCSPVSGQRLRLTLNGYAVLDYLPKLTEITNNNINTALIMKNDTTHENSFLQAPQYIPTITVTNYGNSRFAKEASYHVNVAAIKRLAEWFDFLKKENVYDNTRIILVADHGSEANYINKIGLPFNVEQFNPLLMYKDFDSSGEIKTDMTFMSNADVPYLSLVNVIEDPKNPFTGNAISIERKNDPLYIAISGSIHLSDSNNSQFQLNPNKDYYVHDNIFTAENWIPVLEKK
jgi:YidC/Oxa1 family membrane protein insertase